MTDETDKLNPISPRPQRNGVNRYAALKERRVDLFEMNLKAACDKGDRMDEGQFLIELVFKPLEPNLKLRPAESQLLLAYIGEILKEIEEEERKVAQFVEEDKSK
jgi:hypothetical protein